MEDVCDCPLRFGIVWKEVTAGLKESYEGGRLLHQALENDPEVFHGRVYAVDRYDWKGVS
ncbi:Thiamine transporter [Venturia inaequalis]|nr:Thiamine transporter [Venturia inaequalis]